MKKITYLIKHYIKILINNQFNVTLILYLIMAPLKFVTKYEKRFLANVIKKFSFITLLNEGDFSYYVRIFTGESLSAKMDWEWRHIKTLISPGDVVLDLGACIGKYSVKMAKLVGETGAVIAFEPNPDNYYLLKNNLRLNNIKNCRCFNAAISDFIGTTDFMKDLFEPQSSKMMYKQLHSQNDKNTISVNVHTLDSIIKSINLNKVDFCKIDVEGEEYNVLKGARNTLLEHELKLWIEIHEPLSNYSEIKKFLDHMLYDSVLLKKIYLYEKKRGDVKSLLFVYSCARKGLM